jgi:hypothetical protein
LRTSPFCLRCCRTRASRRARLSASRAPIVLAVPFLVVGCLPTTPAEAGVGALVLGFGSGGVADTGDGSEVRVLAGRQRLISLDQQPSECALSSLAVLHGSDQLANKRFRHRAAQAAHRMPTALDQRRKRP